MSVLQVIIRAALLWCLTALPALAQDNLPDYDAWDELAARAEAAVETGEVSTDTLNELRTELAEWRDTFLAAQDINKERIDTLQGQISALGPEPAEGEEEAEGVANRRAELNDALSRLQEPVIAAEEAHTRASGLIAEIDNTIRTRQTEELLSLGPSPLNPVNWPNAAEKLGEIGRTLTTEITDTLRTPSRLQVLRDGGPLVVGLLLLSLVLLLRGRHWVERMGARLVSRNPRGQGVWQFTLSLGQIALPQLGLFALSEALLLSGLFGPLGTELIGIIPVIGLTVVVGHWLAGQLFPKPSLETPNSPLPSFAEKRTVLRRYASLLAFVLALRVVLAVVLEQTQTEAATMAVLGFPVLIIGGVLLYKLGQYLSVPHWVRTEEAEEVPFRITVLRGVGRLVMAIAVLGPALSAFGYNAAATALVYPMILTLGLMGLIYLLQIFIADLYGLFTGSEEGARDALMPVLIGFTLAISSLPLFALIWGARLADLTELWAQFREGFTFGETRISPADFLVLVIVFVLLYLLTRLLQGTLRSSILPRTRLDTGGRNAIVSGVGYVGIFVAAVAAISSAGINLTSLAYVAGALSVGIGFGLQNVVSNFVSGIILLIERPISEGDWIEVNGQMGHVRDISVRSTRVETFDRTDLIVPNADLISNTVTNYTRGNNVGRVIVQVGVAYGTDTRRVEEILREIAEAHPMVLLNPKPGILFMAFGASSLDFEVRMLLRDVNFFYVVKSEINHQIVERFAAEGIEIPFAQTDIWLRNPETLRPAGEPSE